MARWKETSGGGKESQWDIQFIIKLLFSSLYKDEAADVELHSILPIYELYAIIPTISKWKTG